MPGPVRNRSRQYGFKVGASVNLKKKQAKLDADIRYLKTVINAEMHTFKDTASGNADSTGVIVSLNDIAQGDDIANRTGTSVLPRFQSINMYINKSLTGVDHDTMRLILFRYWGEQTSAAPTVNITDILESSSVVSHLNEDNTGAKGDRERRIEVLKSKLFTLDQVARTSMVYKWNVRVNGPYKQIKEHIKYRTSQTEEPISGGFYLLLLSTNATAANKSAYTIESKLGFYDN